MSEEDIVSDVAAPVQPAPEESATASDNVEPSPADAIIERWYADSFHNLGLPTDLQNRFHVAKERLKSLLACLK